MFEQLKAAINAALDAAMPVPDWHDLKRQMHGAAVEGRAAIAKMREDLAEAEQRLARERQHLTDAQRRGQMAAEIDDAETVEVAARFEAKHQDRVTVLEQKVAAQQAELELAHREVEDMVAQLRAFERQGVGGRPVHDREAFPDTEDAALKAEIDQAQREASADAQLRELKKRMGK